MSGNGFQPLGLDSGDHPGIEPGCLNQFGSNCPGAGPIVLGGTGEDEEFFAMGPLKGVLCLAHGDVPQAAGKYTLVHSVIGRRLAVEDNFFSLARICRI